MKRPVYSKGPGKGGFTLVELLSVIGLTTILLALVIPSLVTLQKNLEFMQLNNDAKEIFLAAQNHLSQTHASGAIASLRAEDERNGAYPIPADRNAGFPAGGIQQYCYTTSEESDRNAFGLILPHGVVDETLREKHILIEYNPTTGNIYSVFYSRKNILSYTNGSLSRDEEKRRELRLGYYCGSLSSGQKGSGDTSPSISVNNNQELSFTVCVPVPDAYRSDWDTFQKAVTVSATVSGSFLSPGGGFTVTSDSPDFQKKLSGQNLVCTFSLDSLKDGCGFSELAGNNRAGSTSRAMSAIENEGSFQILPGDNLTIRASVSAVQPKGKSALPPYGTEMEAETNSLFERLEPDAATGKYIVHLANGRQLQNLNALSPGVAKSVERVVLDRDIYWNDTVQFYGTSNSAASAPGRCLPYFVPISNPALFGGAVFDGDTLRNTAASGTAVDGGGKKVWYLNIDSGKASPAASAGTIYTGSSNLYGNDCFTGLFSFVNGGVKDLSLVNPTVSGKDTRASGRPSAGALAGVCGRDAFLENCSVFLDVKDRDYGGPGSSYTIDSENKVRSDFGVTGYGAVGGLAGYAVSSRAALGDPTGTESDTVFSHCFAALNIKGTANGSGTGLVNGVGGFAGCLDLADCLGCYASGNVTASGSGADSAVYRAVGAGGFTGTSLGSKFFGCFASGDAEGAGSGGFIGVMYDWDSGSRQKSSFRDCYAAGTVSTGEGFCGFCGSGNGYTAADLPQPKSLGPSDAGYADYYDNAGAAKPYTFRDSYCLGCGTFSAFCSQAVGYDTLRSLSALRSVHSSGAFPAASWEAAAKASSHSYAKPDSGWPYPLPKLTGLDYYGDWEYKAPTPGGFVYYEKYSDGSYGFYQNAAISTLKDSSSGLTVSEDGYAILSDTNLSGTAATLNGSSVTLQNPQLCTENGRKCFLYPLTLSQNAGTAFYTKEELSYSDSSGPKDFTCYCDPDFAHTQVQSVGNADSDVPAAVAVRSVRQLTNINRGSEDGKRYFSADYHYLQEMDIDLKDTDGLSIGLIIDSNWWWDTHNFCGSYTGNGKGGAAVAVKNLKQPLFYILDSGSSLGNLTLTGAANQTGLGVGGKSFGYAASENRGAVNRIAVSVPAGSSGTVSVENGGLVTGISSGSLKDCSANLEPGAAFSIHAGGGAAGGITGQADGDISGCSVTLNSGAGLSTAAGYSGGIAGLSTANISGCSVTVRSASASFTAVQGGGHNGGLVGSSTGGVSNCTFLLSGSSLTMYGGLAGGMAGSANRITGCSAVLDAGTVSAPNSGATLGGFAGELTESAEKCSLSGTGTVTSGGSASGFAGTVSGNITGCTVTPVRLDSGHTGDSAAQDYYRSGYSQLKISGRTASGFAGTVAAGKTVRSCRAVCSVSGISGVGGFVCENNGTVEISYANTALDDPNDWARAGSCAGFAEANAGTVRNCYCWYQASGFADGFVCTNSGSIASCYAAPLGSQAVNPFTEQSGCSNCFGVGTGTSAGGVSNITLDDLAGSDIFRRLSGGNGIWTAGGTLPAYPFTQALDSARKDHTNYPYPMLGNSGTADGELDHLGDWAIPSEQKKG